MRDVIEDLATWWDQGATFAIGTVVATFKSAPRPAGAIMAVGPGGAVVGSVSGGCVEGAVYDLATEVTASGSPALQRYGISNDDAFAVGLTCGGILDVWVEQVSKISFPEFGAIVDLVRMDLPFAIATVLEHPDEARIGRRIVVHQLSDAAPENTHHLTWEGSLGAHALDAHAANLAWTQLQWGESRIVECGADGDGCGKGVRIFLHALASRPRMIVIGAIDFAGALARVGSVLGYEVTVCDARPVFATPDRFPDAHQVVVQWPHRYLAAERDAGRIDGRTAIALLTHDPKFDVPALEVALRLPAIGYIGAMGSRRTHADRHRRLRDAGLSDDEISPLASPIGLDLGARTPEETAVSIAAEIIARRWGGEGKSLSATHRPIHASEPRTGESVPSPVMDSGLT